MNIQPIVPDSVQPAQSAQVRSVTQDQFLQLLITQLQHQDPLKPPDASHMLAQRAQFSALAQMKSRSQSSARQPALAMIGHQVAATGEDGQAISGTVLAVLLAGSGAQLQLTGGASVDAARVSQVLPADAAP